MSQENYFTRSAGIVPSYTGVHDVPIAIIGCGGVGSFVAETIARMGFRDLHLMDFDTVEEENVGVQNYRVKDIGQPKVKALADYLEEVCELQCSYYNMPFTEDSDPFPGIVITALDSMAARKVVWEIHHASNETEAIIDPRMSAERASCYVMQISDPADRKAYPQTLTDDSRTEQATCTSKATMYMTSIIAGFVGTALKQFLLGPEYPRISRIHMSGTPSMSVFNSEKPWRGRHKYIRHLDMQENTND